MNPLTSATILVCGVAGVGKTRLIRAVIRQSTDVVTWSAGEIIAEARHVTDAEVLRKLPEAEMERSQELLVNGYEARRSVTPNVLILLDGHSVIDTDGGLFEIAINVVGRLGVTGLIHVRETVEKILAHRRDDATRVRPERSALEIEHYQSRSIKQCEIYSVALQLPLYQVQSGDVEGMYRAVQLIRSHASTGRGPQRI